jgi:polyisoprenoid-binding protein YceI
MTTERSLQSSAAEGAFPLGYELGPSNGTLTVRTGRAGVASRAGHDLLIEASRWIARLMLDTADAAKSQLTVTVDATSLDVRDGTGGVKVLTDDDRAEIKGNIAKKVLQTDRHPEVTFVSTSLQPIDDGRLSVSGDLTIAGTTRPVDFEMTVGADPGRVSATIRLDQSDFGIKPFSALMGTLKVADTVEIHADAQLPAG